jgi:NADPH:quinone reductase-like Zn-dependent oxidoreductase
MRDVLAAEEAHCNHHVLKQIDQQAMQDFLGAMDIYLEVQSYVVTDITVGDRVVLMHSGVLASNVVVPQEACIKLPRGLSMEDAATMLTA